MNNYQWLLQMDGADRKAWFDAEHAEHQERALDGDTEPENEDSRERLEADAFAYLQTAYITYPQIIKLLDRQAAITEEKTRYKWVTASAEEIAAWRSKAEKLKEQVYELTAERDELKEEIAKYEHDCGLLFDEKHKLTTDAQKWADAANVQRLVAIEQADKVQELTAERDKLKEQLRIGWECECRLQAERDNLAADLMRANNERERYREKFGKCIDYADAIHALMDDEGMA